MNDLRPVALFVALNLVIGTTSFAQTSPPKAKDIICKDSKATDQKTCRELCIAWPTTKLCRLSLRFGAPGVKYVFKAQSDTSLKVNIEKNAITQLNFSKDEARRFRWFLTHDLGIFDNKPPTRSSKFVKFSQIKALKTLQDDVSSAKTPETLTQSIDKMLATGKRVYGTHDVGMLPLYRRAASASVQLKEMGQSWHYFQLAHNLAQKKLPEDHPERAQVALDFAQLLNKLRDHKTAIQHLVEVNKTMQSLYQGAGRLHLETRQRLATQYIRANMASKAIPLLESNVLSFIQHYGPTHPKTMDAYKALGNAARYAKQNRKAINAYQKALRILEDKKQGNSVMGIEIQFDIALMEARRNRRAWAKHIGAKRIGDKVLLKSLETQIEESYLLVDATFTKINTSLKDQPDQRMQLYLANSLLQQSLFNRDNKRLKKAYQQAQLAHKIYAKQYPTTHVRVLIAAFNLAHLDALQGNHQKALTQLAQLLKHKQSFSNPTLLAFLHQNSMQIFQRAGDTKQAKTALLEAIEQQHKMMDTYARQIDANAPLIMQQPIFELADKLLSEPNDLKTLLNWKIRYWATKSALNTRQKQEETLRYSLNDAQRARYEQWRYLYFDRQIANPPSPFKTPNPAFKAIIKTLPKKDMTPQVCARLKEESTMLVFIQTTNKAMPQTDPTKPVIMQTHYMALQRSPSCQDSIVDLGPRAQIDLNIQAYQQGRALANLCKTAQPKDKTHTCTKQVNEVMRTKAKLDTLWTKLTVPNQKKWWIVPSGAFELLDMAAFDTETTVRRPVRRINTLLYKKSH